MHTFANNTKHYILLQEKKLEGGNPSEGERKGGRRLKDSFENEVDQRLNRFFTTYLLHFRKRSREEMDKLKEQKIIF